jgi:hypothetical protein
MERVHWVVENRQSHIIYALLEELNLHERLDLIEFLEFLTKLFYECRERYVESGYEESGAIELAMQDIRDYALGDAAEE